MIPSPITSFKSSRLYYPLCCLISLIILVMLSLWLPLIKPEHQWILSLFQTSGLLVALGCILLMTHRIQEQVRAQTERTALDNEAKRLALMKERLLLSHELHDSLAQTLASLRFQVKFLDETLQKKNIEQAQLELKKIRVVLEKANIDLRELLGNFRTPMDKRGLIPALMNMCQQLEQETSMAVYFQDETAHRQLLPVYEVQVLHIAQEALSNVRKHSQAKYVRVLLKSDAKGMWYLLVEDDGQGMDDVMNGTHPGQHIGLSIMCERARYLDTRIDIESEAGDGTRIELRFKAKTNST